MTRSEHYRQLFRHLLSAITLVKQRLHSQEEYHGLIEALRYATRDFLGETDLDRTDEAIRTWDWVGDGAEWMRHAGAAPSPREDRFRAALARTSAGDEDEAAANWLAPYVQTVVDAHLSGDRDRERRSLARLAAESDWLKTRL